MIIIEKERDIRKTSYSGNHRADQANILNIVDEKNEILHIRGSELMM